MQMKSVGLLLVIATWSASAGPSTPPGRTGVAVTPWPIKLPCPRFKEISLWIPADAPRTLEWRVQSDAAPLLILEPGSPLSPNIPAELLPAEAGPSPPRAPAPSI